MSPIPFDFASLWASALTFDDFLAIAGREHLGLWEGIHRTARLPAWLATALPSGTQRNYLVLVEDWCGDASNTVPLMAKFAETVPGVALRLLLRDQHPAVMDRYLTNGSRSIPIAIVLDAQFRELGHWGPRPAALQQWVMEHKATMPKEELYPQVRRWYAKDRGETTFRELLAAERPA